MPFLLSGSESLWLVLIHSGLSRAMEGSPSPFRRNSGYCPTEFWACQVPRPRALTSSTQAAVPAGCTKKGAGLDTGDLAVRRDLQADFGAPQRGIDLIVVEVGVATLK